MRKFTPVLIVLAAVALYAARDVVLTPFMPATRLADRLTREASQHPPGSPLLQTASLDGRNADPAATTASSVVKPPAEPTAGKIRRNSSLYVELRGIGVTPQEIDGIVRASRKQFNLRKVRAGQAFDVYTSGAGSVDSLFFYFSRERFLGVRRDVAEGFVATIDTLPYTITYHVTEGTIEQSVFVALQSQGAETDLAGQMAEIFGWTIDFFTDIRRGDSFAVLYERKSYEDGRTMLGKVLAARVVSSGRDYYGFRFDAGPGRGGYGYYDESGNSLEKSLRRTPVKYTRVTSSFSHRRYHPINKRYQPHYGVDFGADYGTPVYSTGDGSVLVATRRSGNGKYVKIKHNNAYTTYYLHLQRFAKGIRKGKKVRQGDVIGYVGSTGWANGPHVCYRIKRNGSWVNPRGIKLPSKEPVPRPQLAQFERERDACLLRLRETILDGVDNHTTLVTRPSYTNDAQMRTIF